MSSDDDDDEIEAKNENLKQLYWCYLNNRRGLMWTGSEHFQPWEFYFKKHDFEPILKKPREC